MSGTEATGEKEDEAQTTTKHKMTALFIDEGFPIDVQVRHGHVAGDAVWLRPHEICKDPQLFVNGGCHLDVTQGILGDCWLLAACAAIADHPKLVHQLISEDQALSVSSEKYTGKIVVNLWQNGEFNPITIDDMLPTKSQKLLYGCCKNKAEFWLPLVEKALAKYYGGYKLLEKRELAEGLLTLTGFSIYRINTMEDTNSIDNLFEKFRTELNRGSLIICAGHLQHGNRASLVKHKTKGGKQSSGYHSFSVTYVDNSRRKVRIFNPWGRNAELPNQDRYKISKDKATAEKVMKSFVSSTTRHGEMWMEMENFVKAFEEVCIANEKPSVIKDKLEPATEPRPVRGEWKGRSAAGPVDGGSFEDNPQFLLEIDVTCQEKKKVPVLVELLQDMHRQKYPTAFAAGFSIHHIPKDVSNQPFETQGHFSLENLTSGEVTFPPVHPALNDAQSSCIIYHHYFLKPKERYVIVAFTREARKERRFVLRVHTAHAYIRLRELPDVPDAPYAQDVPNVTKAGVKKIEDDDGDDDDQGVVIDNRDVTYHPDDEGKNTQNEGEQYD